MAKKKQHSRPAPRVIPRRYRDDLDEAQKLFDKKRWDEARDKLEDLDRCLPGQPDILTNLVNVYYELRDTEGYQSASERLLQVDRNNADATLGLAGAYLSNGRPMLALRAFREFVRRWPDHSRANEVRKTITDLDDMMPELLQDLDLPTEQAGELAAQHEKVQSLLAQGRYREVRQAAETILKCAPKFAPALNNLSMAQWSDGHSDQAIASAQRVLEFEPDNIHALSNLVRFLCAAGRQNDARLYAERLKVSLAPATDAVFKKVEGLSYLGDDQGVLELVRQIEQDTETEHSARLTAMFYHLAGVAARRMGQEGEARSYWQRSLKLSPGFQFAKENLDDLKKTVGERHGPWSFSFPHWVSHKAILDFERAIRPALGRDDAVVERAARRYVYGHPDIVAVAPVLLERGDPQGREFVVNLARLSKSPELMGLLKDFALSQNGPDKLRLEAAQLVRETGLLPAGPTRIWSKGEWRDLLLLGFEIYDEPELTVHSPQVTEWMQDAVLALRERDVQRAEPLLRKALAEEPDRPDLLNNLAVVYELRGQHQEKEALVREIHERYPDYFFGRVNMARQCIREGNYERARLLLDPLLRQNRMHTSEFVALCTAEIELHLAQGNVDVARSWFDFWDSTHLSDAQIEQYRSRLGVRPMARSSRISRWLNPFRKSMSNG
jgi:tetratricopeptide (TPR) repeat protein